MTNRPTDGSHNDGWNDGDTFCGAIVAGLALWSASALITQFADGSGTAADWLAALAASVALVFAAVAARAALRGLSIERARDIERDEQHRRQQAELISGWVSELATATIDNEVVGVTGWTVTLRNGSSLPVFRVRGLAYFEGGSGERGPKVDFSVPVLGPGDTPSAALSSEPGAYIPTEQFGVPIGRVIEVLLVDLTFTDHRGLRWRRRGDGVIEHAISS